MAAEAIGNLYAVLGIDTGRFDAGVDKAKGKLNDFGKTNFSKGLKAGLDEVDGALKGLAGNAGALGGILSGLGIGGVAAAAAIAVAFNGARDAMAFGDDIADTANKLKVTTDYLQEMRFAAHGLGGDFQDADDAIEAFTKNFGLATSGLSAKAVKPFEALGLDPKSFATTQDALDAVIAKIGGLGSAAEQAAVADKLGLTPLLPALREGTAAIDDMRQAAHDIGYVMDAELIEKAGDANDKYEALNAVLGVQFKSAMLEAVPALMQMTEMMVDAAKWAGDFAGKLNDVAAAYDRLSTHDFAGNNVGNDRNRLFGRMQQQQAVRQASSLSDWLNPKYDRVLPGQTLAAGNLSSVLDAPKEKPNELKDIREQNDRVAAARKAAGEAARAAAAAERARAAVLKAEADALHDAEQRSADYLAGLMEEVGTMGMSTEMLKRRRAEMEAAAAPTEALANQIRAVEKQRRAQNQVSEEAADKEKQVNDQLSETLKTLYDMVGLGPHFTTTLESMAMDLDKAAGFARGLSYDVDDIARSINDNDWTSAMAGLVNVLANVEQAFKTAKTAQEKFNAVASVAQAAGSAVGGTGGAALSGAASGAMAGKTLGGPIGAAIGGILGGLGGIFGSSKAKKQAKAQAAAQKAAEEAQRQQQIADIRLANSIALLRAQGKEQEAVNMERQAELAALARLDASLLAGQQSVYDALDARDAEAKAADLAKAARAQEIRYMDLTGNAAGALAMQREDELAAMDESLRARQREIYAYQDLGAAQAKAADIQGRIDALTLSPEQQLAKKREEERAAVRALSDTLDPLLEQLYGLEDAASLAEAATQAQAAATQAQAAATQAASEAWNEQQRLAAFLTGQTTDAMKVQADAIRGTLDALGGIVGKFTNLSQTLNDLADSLGIGDTSGLNNQAARDAAWARLQAASPDDTAAAVNAFVNAARDAAPNQSAYRLEVARAQDIARQRASQASQSAAFFGSMFSSLPGFATGGAITLGGNPGVDQNLLSLNNNPVARVGRGETLGILPAGFGGGWTAIADMTAELRNMRATLDAIKGNTGATASNTEETHGFLRNGTLTVAQES